VKTEGDNGYEKMANEMVEQGFSQPGFLGAESVSGKWCRNNRVLLGFARSYR
jgi:heme-degrading monooxygenase HmoA